MNRKAALSLDDQRKLVIEIVRLAEKLEELGDPYLRAQYMHLKERASALHSVLETEEGALLPG
jgi:hypothetical protein